MVFNAANILRQAARNEEAEHYYRIAVNLRPKVGDGVVAGCWLFWMVCLFYVWSHFHLCCPCEQRHLCCQASKVS